MKTLYLVRHAKAEDPSLKDTDFERELTEKGEKQTHSVGKQCYDNGYNIDIIIASPAARAKTTAINIAAEMHYPEDIIHYDENIFNNTLTDYLKIIHSIKNHHTSAMIVGHNPTMTELANYLSGDNLDNLSTCACYAVKFEINDWQAIAKHMGIKINLIMPS